MKTLLLKSDLYYCGVTDPNLRVFDIIMRTEYGTTYNAYLLKGSEKTALFETSKEKYTEDYLASVTALTDLNKIDYLIVDHTEPDHAGSIEALVRRNPNLKIVGTSTAITFLKAIVKCDFYSLPVKDGDTLSLGDKTLHFMALPNLHWPDTMYTYVPECKALFTCDSFGSHYSHEGILRSTVSDVAGYWKATKYYFDNILGPFKRPYLVKALEKIKDLDYDIICCGHGPVLDSNIDELLEAYRGWCEEGIAFERKTVVMPYVSAYGYTAALAKKIMAGILDSGDIEVRPYDMVTADFASVAGELARADGMLFGTPTILGEALKPIWDLTTSLYSPIVKGKLAAAFGSYGWSGEGVPDITERLRQLKLKVLDGYRVRFKPGANELLDAYEFGYNFGCVLQNKENDRKNQTGTRKLVRCIVCGEIFDASIDVCPVCGAGRESFVPVEDDASGFIRDTKERFLILGGGAAAYQAAAAIRQRNRTAVITLLSAEKALPYNRPMLTKSMLAGFSDDQLAISPAAWYTANRIDFRGGVTVLAIDTARKTVSASDGDHPYDKLIYALGARCFVPPIPGSDLPHVVSVRSVCDAEKIKAMLPKIHSAVIIGGGVLGLESAWELSKSGINVTVLEAAPQIMGRQIDATAANLLVASASKHGIPVLTNAQITAITPDAVTTADGHRYLAELVIVSAGVRANAEIAKSAGIAVDRAVIVNEKAQTNLPDIYACGDCAQYEGINYALWEQAVAMGKVAGANAAGDDLSYTQIAGALSYQGLDTRLFAVGDNGKKPDTRYKTVEFRDDARGTLEKYYFANNRLCGVELIGDISKIAELSQAVAENRLFRDVIHLS